MDIERCSAMIERHEGRRLHPYLCPAGKMTIGVGRNLIDTGISHEEAEMLLRNDIRRIYAEMLRQEWFCRLDDVRQEALVDMAFNLGIAGVFGFRRMIASLTAGDYAAAAGHALDSAWARQVGSRARELAEMIAKGESYVPNHR